jgi:hypothetical protein
MNTESINIFTDEFVEMCGNYFGGNPNNNNNNFNK